MDILAAVPADRPDELSWWQQDAKAEFGADARPRLVGRTVADVAIIGGGFTGLWTALTLKERQPKFNVVIIEAYRCGDGASARNGGNVHGYWGALPTLLPILGPDKALDAARLGTIAQRRLRDFATASRRDIWWVEDGYLRVATSATQVKKLRDFISVARQLGVSDTLSYLTRHDLGELCSSPQFQEGLLFHEGATVHPARLAHSLRQAVLDAGVTIYENSPVKRIQTGREILVETSGGNVAARDVVLATYTGTMALPSVAKATTIFSSFPVMSEPDPEVLEQIKYTTARGLADLRMFTHYFRRTRDGRILMGSGSGPLEMGKRHYSQKLRSDPDSFTRAEIGLKRFFPGMRGGVAARWGFPIDVTSDRLPFFGTLDGTRIHYGSGYSGHGVNATVIAGECLTSLILNEKDQWTLSPFCKRNRLSFPPEPFRFIGGVMVRKAIVRCEDAEDAGSSAPALSQMVANLPRMIGMRVGTR